MERPFYTILRTASSAMDKTKENLIFTFNQNDKIIIWIVGFSITAISLIISNAVNLPYTKPVLKTILILLLTSVLFGLIFRVAALYNLKKIQSLMFKLDGAFYHEKCMPSEPKNVNEKNIVMLNQQIIEDFGFDYYYIVNLYNSTTNEQEKLNYLNYMKGEYFRLVEWSASEYQFAENYIKNTFQETFKLSNKTTNKIFSENNDALYYKISNIISIISLIITMISFISVLIILACNY